MVHVKHGYHPLPVIDDAVKGVSMEILIGKAEESPTCVMRRFKVESGGYTFKHTHDFEHVVYVLSGKATLYAENGEFELNAGTHLIVKPNELHQFKADRGEDFEFLCTIPLM